MNVDWSTVPDWLGALGSLSAASVAVYLAYREGQRADEAEAEGRRLRQRLEREQASKVAAWTERLRDEVLGWGSYVRVRNASEEPVFTVELRWPGTTEVHRWSVIAPGGTVQAETEFEKLRQEPLLWFTDGAGIRWKRGPRGVLQRSAPPPPGPPTPTV